MTVTLGQKIYLWYHLTCKKVDESVGRQNCFFLFIYLFIYLFDWKEKKSILNLSLGR